MEERKGFEPLVHFWTTVFKTAALDHSATFPVLIIVADGVAVSPSAGY